MDVNEVNSIIKQLNSLSEGRQESFFKSLAKNKFVIGSVAIASGMTLVNAIKHISLQNIVTSLFPSQLTNVSLVGVPLGGMAFKLVGFAVGGTIVAEAIKFALAIKACKSSSEVFDVILKEGIAFVFLIVGFYIMGKLGVDILNTGNNISMPTF